MGLFGGDLDLEGNGFILFLIFILLVFGIDD